MHDSSQIKIKSNSKIKKKSIYICVCMSIHSTALLLQAMAWKAPGCPLILTTLFLRPPFSLTSFNLSASSFLQSSLSSFDKSKLRITLLKLSLSFNLLLLSRTGLLVSKLSNIINNFFANSEHFQDFFFYFFRLLLSGALTRALFLLTFRHLLSNCRV